MFLFAHRHYNRTHLLRLNPHRLSLARKVEVIVLEQAIYESLPYILATAAVALGFAMRLFIRNGRQNLEVQEVLADGRKARLKSIHQTTLQEPPADSHQSSASESADPLEDCSVDACAESDAPIATESNPDRDVNETPNRPSISVGGDPIKSQFLGQIRYFEEQFNARLSPAEKKIVDSVLRDSLKCDLSLAVWWENVRNDWDNREFVAHVDTLHPNLSQS